MSLEFNSFWLDFFQIYESRIHFSALAFMFFGAGGAMIQSKWPFSHRHRDSRILIYHQTEFHLVVVLIHLWVLLCSIIGTRHLYTNSNFPFTVFFLFVSILFDFSDWFFSLPWSSDTLGVFSAMLSVCAFFCLFVVVVLQCSQYANMHSTTWCR